MWVAGEFHPVLTKVYEAHANCPFNSTSYDQLNVLSMDLVF